MRSGVNGGIKDMIVAKLPPGSRTTGKYTNIGIIIGSKAGMVRLCVSLGSLHVAPNADAMEPSMIIAKSINVRNHGIT